MNWTTFLIYLLGAYLLYYLVNVLLDLLMRTKRNARAKPFPVYQIEKEPEPIDASLIPEEEPLTPEEAQVLSSGALEATGAVKLDRLLMEAQAEAIECTKKILQS